MLAAAMPLRHTAVTIAPALIFGLTVAAAVIPARRAARIDPFVSRCADWPS